MFCSNISKLMSLGHSFYIKFLFTHRRFLFLQWFRVLNIIYLSIVNDINLLRWRIDNRQQNETWFSQITMYDVWLCVCVCYLKLTFYFWQQTILISAAWPCAGKGEFSLYTLWFRFSTYIYSYFHLYFWNSLFFFSLADVCFMYDHG